MLSDDEQSFNISLINRTPAGRTRARLVYEVKPFGTNFDGSGLEYSSWSDNGLTGTEVGELVNGLNPDTAYHWRVRIQYFPFMNYSPWYSTGNNGWSEMDLRTLADTTPPELAIETPSDTVLPGEEITFTIISSDEVSDIVKVEFQIDGTAGTWIECTATDGAFDELVEEVTCNIPAGLSLGQHTIYFRATDAAGNTSQISYFFSVVEELVPTGSNIFGFIFISMAVILLILIQFQKVKKNYLKDYEF